MSEKIVPKQDSTKSLSFDKEFRLLLSQSIEVVRSRYSVAIDSGEVRPELVCLNRYLAIYGEMLPEEHFIYFDTLYNRYRVNFLSCLQEDNWLRDGKIAIQFGEGIKRLAGKCSQIKIPLSDVYRAAKELQAVTEKAFESSGPEFVPAEGGKDLIRPQILLLHLFRIFHLLQDGTDKTALAKIVNSLETELGVSKSTFTSNSTSPEPDNNSGLSSLFKMATGMMENMGIQTPPGVKAPTDSDISGVINGVLNNEGTQNFIQKIFSSIKTGDNVGEVINSVIKNATDPASLEVMQASINNTVAMKSEGNSLEVPKPLGN